MAETNSVTDTQALVQSMLQRLKLQTNNENEKHTQEIQQSPSTQHNYRITEAPSETPVFHFNGSLDTNHEGNSRSTKSADLDSPLTLHSPYLKGEVKPVVKQSAKGIGKFASPNSRSLRWGFLSNFSSSRGSYDINSYTDNNETPKWQWKQKLRKMSDSSSISSLQSLDSSMPSSPTLYNQDQWDMSKRGGLEQKRWNQKTKERLKNWHKSVEKREKELKDDHVAKSIHSSSPLQTLSNETHTTSTALSEDTGVHHQPVNTGPEESPLSSPDQWSDLTFSLGPINLMEEIFTGQEWAKFFSPDIKSQSESSYNVQEQAKPPSTLNQLSRQEQTILSPLDYKDPHFGMTQTQVNSGAQYMDTTHDTFNQRNPFDFSLSPSNQLHQGQNNLSYSGSNHLDSMDLSVSPSEISEPMKERLDQYPYNQSKSTDWHAHQIFSSHNQAQGSELHQVQPENGHVEMHPVMDLSYLQSNDHTSLKKELSLSRKRSHCPERRGSSEQSRLETSDLHDHSATSENPSVNLSAASSSSSLQYTISQESESTASTETVVKKRRVENTRRVRFAEEVIFLPPLILSDDEDEDEAEDNDISEYNEEDEDCQDEPSPGPSVPQWIAALRNKTKKTPKLRLPHMSRFRTRKKNVV